MTGQGSPAPALSQAPGTHEDLVQGGRGPPPRGRVLRGTPHPLGQDEAPPSSLCSHCWRPLPLECTRQSCHTPHVPCSGPGPGAARSHQGRGFLQVPSTHWAPWGQQRERAGVLTAALRPWETQRTPLLQGAFPDHQVTRGLLYLSLCMELIGVSHNFLSCSWESLWGWGGAPGLAPCWGPAPASGGCQMVALQDPG